MLIKLLKQILVVCGFMFILSLVMKKEYLFLVFLLINSICTVSIIRNTLLGNKRHREFLAHLKQIESELDDAKIEAQLNLKKIQYSMN